MIVVGATLDLLSVGVSAQTQDTKNEFEMIFRFFCATQTPLPHPSRHTKDTKDLDWEPVWEPDGEPADVPDPRLRMGPSSSSPSSALRTTVVRLIFSIQTRDVGNQRQMQGSLKSSPRSSSRRSGDARSLAKGRSR